MVSTAGWGVGTPPLSFNDALERIIGRSTAIGIQKENLQALRARNLSSHLSLLPTLSVQANHTQSKDQFEEGTGRAQSIAAVASLNLFGFGADAAAMKAANREEEALELSVSLTVLSEEDTATKLLVDRILAHQTYNILKQLRQLNDEAHRISRERFAKGLLASQEVDKIVIDLDNANAELRDAEMIENKALADLRARLGNEDVVLEWPWRSQFDPFALPKTGETEIAKRPDFRQAQKKLEAAEARVRQSFGKIFPSLDATLSYGYSEGPNRTPGTQTTGALTLTIPLFDRLTQYGGYRAEVHSKAATELDLERIRRDARSDLESSKVSFEIALETSKTREKTVNTSRRLYQSNLARFQRGLISANELAQDQTRLQHAELFAIRGWASAHNGFARLCHAMGRQLAECLLKQSD